MKKKIMKEEILQQFFCEVVDEKPPMDIDVESRSSTNYYGFPKEEIYYFNNKKYKLKNLQDVNIRESLLFYLYKHNFYLPKVIKRIIFKNVLLKEDKEDQQNFNYNIYLLLSYVNNPIINESTQKIIDLDVFRTRIVKNKKRNIFFFNIFLNYACYYFHIKYKQGLNEVLALFFYLEGKYFNLVDVYFCFQNFVEIFLKEFYYDDEFYFLQISFYLFKVLITYHDPTLSEILERNKMTPEIYASSWFLTLFASKSHFQILSLIYLIFILEKNPFFYFFFSLALLILHRDTFMHVDSSNLPELLSKLNIFNRLFLRKVYALAKYLEKNTPISFTHKLVFVKNVLVHLAKENTSESHNNKNVLLNFFKNIDYMPVNAYELYRDLTSGNRHFVFVDIRSAYHYWDFRLKDSVNIEPLHTNLERLKEYTQEKEKYCDKKRKRTTIKKDPKIFYILKHFNNCEIVGNDRILFLYLLRNKYNLPNNFSYDDCILLKPFHNDADIYRRRNIINFIALEKEKIKKKRRRLKRVRKKRKKKAAGFKKEYKKEASLLTRIYNLIKTKEKKQVDLNFFLQSYYKKGDIKKPRKHPSIQFKSVQSVGHKYMIQKKQKQFKRCYTDEEALSASFDFKCFCIKNTFQKQRKKKITKFNTECNSWNNTLRNDLIKGGNCDKPGKDHSNCTRGKWTYEGCSFNDQVVNKENRRLPGGSRRRRRQKRGNGKGKKTENDEEKDETENEEKNEEKNKENDTKKIEKNNEESHEEKKKDTLGNNTKYLMETNLNRSSFNLYLLIKEKVQAHEQNLQYCFNNIISPNKHVVVIYDEIYNDAKHVKRLYFYLVFTLKWKNVSIVEGGINSYHKVTNYKLNLMDETGWSNNCNQSSKKIQSGEETKENQSSENWTREKKKEKNERRKDITTKCIMCNPNKNKLHRINNFLNLHVCYLCSTKHITRMKKKILDEFFYEIYSDENIFEQFYNFCTGKNNCFNFLSFLYLIEEKKKKKQERRNVDKRKGINDISFSPLTNIFNFIKGKKSENAKQKSQGNSHGERAQVPPEGLEERRKEESGTVAVEKEKADADRHVTERVGLLQKKKSVCYETEGEPDKEKRKDPFSLDYYLEYYNSRRKQGNANVTSPSNCISDTAKDINSDMDHMGDQTGDIKPKRKSEESKKSENFYLLENQTHENKSKLITNPKERKINQEQEELMTYDNKDQHADANTSEETEKKEKKMNNGETNKNQIDKKKTYNSQSDVYNIYTYIDIICYNTLLRTKENCKIYKCFIIYIYQPLIPHNIRSNNMLNNFIEYVKYLQCVKKKKRNTVRTDPNMHLNCNKVEPRFFFNFSYVPYNLRNLNMMNSFLLNNLLKEDSTKSERGNNMSDYGNEDRSGESNKNRNRNRNTNTDRDEHGNEEECENTSEHNILNGTSENHHVEFHDESWEENKNNAILNKSWIRNKPELGMCKLMLYDNLLIICGTPYLYNVTVSDEQKKRNAEGETERETERERERQKEIQKEIQKEREQKNIKGKKNISNSFETGNEPVSKEKGILEEKKPNWTNFKKCKEHPSGKTHIDIGTLNFIKEQREYMNLKEKQLNIDFNGESAICTNGDEEALVGIHTEKEKKKKRKLMGNKIMIHRYKDLKKKDILFNLDCYKINSVNLNWYETSESLFREINKECMLDVYNYYRAYFNLSRNALMAKEETKENKSQTQNQDELLNGSSSDISFSALGSDRSNGSGCSNCSDFSDDIDFSFSDYHNLYKDNAKITCYRREKKRNKLKEEKEKEKEYGKKVDEEDEQKIAVDVVNVYAIFDLHTIYKITTKKKSSTVLYFYFTSNKNIPLVVVNFDNELEAQSCVYSVKQIYAKFAQRK